VVISTSYWMLRIFVGILFILRYFTNRNVANTFIIGIILHHCEIGVIKLSLKI